MEDGGPREISDPPPPLVQELPHCPHSNYNSIWLTRSETPPQMPWPYLEFKDYVIVPYRWATQGEKFGVDEIKQDMDDVRKDAYRNAVKEIMKKTCVAFVEKTKAELEASGEGYIAVGVAVYPGCWAYAGYSGARPYLLSLGWCNSGAFQGSMIHENLHSLGIAHMQKRPDATQNVEGHGPFLQMHWDQIPDGGHVHGWGHNMTVRMILSWAGLRTTMEALCIIHHTIRRDLTPFQRAMQLASELSSQQETSRWSMTCTSARRRGPVQCQRRCQHQCPLE